MRLPTTLLLPLLYTVLLVNAASGEDGKDGELTPVEHFMEEVRDALANQWELLQNLRYHTLGIKVRLVQMEAQIQNLSNSLDAVSPNQSEDEQRDDSRHSRDKGPCADNDQTSGEETVVNDEAEGDNEIQNLLEAMKNLTQVYSNIAAPKLCRKLNIDVDTDTSPAPIIISPTETTSDGGLLDKDESYERQTTVLTHSPNVTTQIGSTAILACRLDSLQDPEQAVWIRTRDQNWLSQGSHKVAASEERLSVDFSEEGSFYRLHLRDVRREDEGAYECHVSTTQTVWLAVIDPPPSPPFLTLTPASSEVVEGRDVTFKCRASGHPEPSITWTRNNLLISPSTRHSITPMGDLVIRGARRRDRGGYTCRAFNSEGEAEGIVRLTVRRPTKILRSPRDRKRFEGESVAFKCRAEGDSDSPLTVKWLKNDEVIDLTNSTRFSLGSNNALMLSSVQLEDAGKYTCLASTDFDAATASAHLIVQEAISATSVPSPQTLPPVDYCPPPYERLQKHVCVFEVSHVKLTWYDAADYCRSEGGRLAWLQEGSVLQELLRGRHGSGGWNYGSTTTRWPFWVGGRKVTNSDEWRWMDGSLVQDSVWAPTHNRPQGLPDDREDWCLILDGYQEYHATALRCNLKRYFLCRLS